MSNQMKELLFNYGSHKAMAEHLQEIIFRYAHCRLLLNEDGIVEGSKVAEDIYFLRHLKKALEELPDPIASRQAS